jgi:hypothetical protein
MSDALLSPDALRHERADRPLDRTHAHETTCSRASAATGRIEGTDNGEPLRLTRDLAVDESSRSREGNAQPLRFPLGDACDRLQARV